MAFWQQRHQFGVPGMKKPAASAKQLERATIGGRVQHTSAALTRASGCWCRSGRGRHWHWRGVGRLQNGGTPQLETKRGAPPAYRTGCTANWTWCGRRCARRQRRARHARRVAWIIVQFELAAASANQAHQKQKSHLIKHEAERGGANGAARRENHAKVHLVEATIGIGPAARSRRKTSGRQADTPSTYPSTNVGRLKARTASTQPPGGFNDQPCPRCPLATSAEIGL